MVEKRDRKRAVASLSGSSGRGESGGLYLKMDIGPSAPRAAGGGNEVKLVDAGHKSLSSEPLSGRSPFYVHRGHQDFQQDSERPPLPPPVL